MNGKAIAVLILVIVGVAFITQCAQQERSEQTLETPTREVPTVQLQPTSTRQAITMGVSPTPTERQPGRHQLQTPTEHLVIKAGTYFGLCRGYCNEEVFITSEGVVFRKTSSDPSDKENPPIVEEAPITDEVWGHLVSSVDFDEFNSLPEVVGCPDCSDGGGEWLEISDGKTTKRVDFEYGASIPEVDELLRWLRGLRQDISSQLDE